MVLLFIKETRMKDNKHIPLTKKQIDQLMSQNCSCDNWKQVLVSPKFTPDSIRNVTFSGKIKLGRFDKQVSFYGGVSKSAGIYNAFIYNCTIGDNVYISNVTNHIANYVIEDDCIIDHIDLLAVEGPTTFGNGTKAVVINEAGGREVMIFDHLTAQIAYILALYRHRPKLIGKIEKMISQYAESVKSDIGVVGKAAHLSNCGTIKNVKIGPAAIIGNIKRLENGTIKSCPEDLTEVGASVVARDFIIAEGAKISEGSIILNCFIGQATKMDRQFSAENSVCFANCGFHHGEICSIFAGPYTVSHHKSTLLIAGLFSFFNAGSGTNESNHMYKTGSVHQGIFERGVKITSDGYIMYPARIGAFSVIVGRHYAHPDTTDIPFSYLFEEEEGSFIIPGINLRTVGTVRDGEKWPRRDERKSPDKSDLIIFDVLSPYTVQKIFKGLELLLNLKPAETNTSKVIVCNNLHFGSAALHKGIEYYTLAINKFLGDCLIEKLKTSHPKSIADIEKLIKNADSAAADKWLDLSGLLAPEKYINSLLDDIETGKLNTIESLAEKLKALYNDYNKYKWSWAAEKIQNIMQKQPGLSETEKVLKIINDWAAAGKKLNALILADAEKEFGDVPRIGFGIDGDEKTRDADFDAVRGTFQTNSFACELKGQQEVIAKTAEEWIRKIRNSKS
jgi:NDP-sugar pyrophosphorylase family protein